MIPPFRLLLVEDFEPFLRFVRSALQARAEFKIVGEAMDGLEAVQKARVLQPDLILLDLGLPKLNGLAAAKQIRAFAPQSKILFISLESSPAAVEEALRGGAQGFVHKLRVHFDLLPAIEAVLAGKQFVSSNLEFSEGTKARCRHEVHFYSDDVPLLNSATRFISGVLKTDGAAILIASESHRDSLGERLKADACDIEAAIRQGTYVSLDAVALSTRKVNSLDDYDRLCESLGGVIESCVKATNSERPRIAVFGEFCGLLCAEGNTEAAIRIEKQTNDLVKTYDVEIMCPYPLSAFHRADDGHAFSKVCAEHTATFSAEDL